MGSSAAVTISPEQLQALGLKAGDEVETSVRGGVLEVRVADMYQRMSDDELLNTVQARRLRA